MRLGDGGGGGGGRGRVIKSLSALGRGAVYTYNLTSSMLLRPVGLEEYREPWQAFPSQVLSSESSRLCLIVWHKVATDKSDVRTSTSEYTKPPRIRKRHQKSDKTLDMTAMDLRVKALGKKNAAAHCSAETVWPKCFGVLDQQTSVKSPTPIKHKPYWRAKPNS